MCVQYLSITESKQEGTEEFFSEAFRMKPEEINIKSLSVSLHVS